MTDDESAQDAELVLSQALRAMAGEGKRVKSVQPAADGEFSKPRMTALQVLLIAVIIGLLIGMGAGIVTLLMR